MVGAFVLGGILAFLMGRSDTFRAMRSRSSPSTREYRRVVISTIWFKGVEFRIFFITAMTTLPAFAFQILDAYRAMSRDLFEMALSFRPSRLALLRTLVVPTVLPGVLTAWKVNLGNAARVVVVAELVGATGGVGYVQQLFDMGGAVAWTLVLVIFVVLMQGLIGALESRLLGYRPMAERAL
jgi:NitT/TauT family transport system permease protein